jgi:hypothetical protein
VETQGIFLRLTSDDRRDFQWCGRHTEHKLQLASIGTILASDESREHLAVEVEARERVRVSPAQTIGQAEGNELLDLLVRGRGVGRPAEGCDDLVSVNAREIVPELDAVTIVVLRDDERAEGSVDVELGFFIFHVYRIAQVAENARNFFTISETIFVDVFSNRRLNFSL